MKSNSATEPIAKKAKLNTSEAVPEVITAVFSCTCLNHFSYYQSNCLIDQEPALTMDIPVSVDGIHYCPCGKYTPKVVSGSDIIKTYVRNFKNHAKICPGAYMILREVGKEEGVLELADEKKPHPAFESKF